MSDENIATPKETAHGWLQIIETWGLKAVAFLTWLIGVVSWLVWVTGDRVDPAPPTPGPPPFVTLDILPQQGQMPGPWGSVKAADGEVIDPDLLAGRVHDYHPRPEFADVLVSVCEGKRVSRLRQIAFGPQSTITLDGKPVTKDGLLAAIEAHKLAVQLYGGRFGPIQHAEFTTIQEQ